MRYSRTMSCNSSPVHKLKVFLIALIFAISQVFGLVGAAAPTVALAEGATKDSISSVETQPGDKNYNVWRNSTGEIMFCGDEANHSVAKAGDTGTIVDPATFKNLKYDSRAKSYSTRELRAISYIMANGYSVKGAVGGQTGWNAARATQQAIWHVLRPGLVPESPEGRKLYNDAIAYADSSSTEYDGTLGLFVPDNGVQVLFFLNRSGSLKLVKTSANPALTDGNNTCYDLAGAEYTVYSDSAATTEVGKITLDSKGEGELTNIKSGTYYVKETKAAKGYALDEEIHEVKVESGKTADLAVKDVPQNDPARMAVQKIDAETGKDSPLGAGTLAGAEFTVKYYNGMYNSESELPSEATRTWVFKTNDKGIANILRDESFVSGDELYMSATGVPTIPLGTITIQETKAPKGYTISDTTLHIQQVTSDGNVESVNTFVAPNVSEQVIRGNIKWVKAIEETQVRVPNALFKITSKTTGETHYVVTDANGSFDSSALKATNNTNANDKAVDADGKVDETKLDSEAGVWFSGAKDAEVKPDDAKGAFPYDTYEVEEIITSATEGTKPVKFNVTVARDGATVDMGTIDDQPDKPLIQTEFTDEGGNHEVEANKEVKLKDTVSYNNLTPGKEYSLTMTIHVKDKDGKDEGELKDKDGKPVTTTVKFTPEKADGTVEVPYTVDTTGLEEKSIVAFESLQKDGKEITSHADITDSGQTIRVKKTPTPPTTPTTKTSKSVPNTGQSPLGMILTGVGLVGIVGSGAWIFIRRRMATNPVGRL
ncbi:VaFE repeat-containing surface-anchored protein [Lancefieldella rimae]|uniref:VaFE repeat-containing surface-anchored protein n=1 Tax=Lancefieldella rimae TaxID=1383 RepID=UPI003C6FFA3C